MSFSISASGTKQQTLEALKKSQGYGDTSHHDAIRDAATAIVESAPDDAKFVVSGSGHHEYPAQPAAGQNLGSANFTISLTR